MRRLLSFARFVVAHIWQFPRTFDAVGFWLSVAVGAAGPALASSGVPPLDKLSATAYVAVGAIGLACSFAWLAFTLDEQRQPRVLFERQPSYSDVDVRRFHGVRVRNPSDTENAEQVRVELTKVERFVSGHYQVLPLRSPPRLLRWCKQEEASDGGWGPRDIPRRLYNEANVVTVAAGHVRLEWKQQYESDPVILERGIYRLTLLAYAAEGGTDTLRLGIDWNGTREASVWNADEPLAAGNPEYGITIAPTGKAAQGFP
jgi:hypothetical protein